MLKNTFALRKLTIGLVPVMFGAVMLSAKPAAVRADEAPAPDTAAQSSTTNADESDKQKSSAPVDAPKTNFSLWNNHNAENDHRRSDAQPSYSQAGLSSNQNLTQNALNKTDANKTVGNGWSPNGIANVPEDKSLTYDLSISAQDKETGKTYAVHMGEDLGHVNHAYLDPVNSRNITLHASFHNKGKTSVQLGTADQRVRGWNPQVVLDLDDSTQHTLLFSKTKQPKITVLNSDGSIDKLSNFTWFYAYNQDGATKLLPNGKADVQGNTCISFHGLLKAGQSFLLDIPLDYNMAGDNLKKNYNDFDYRGGGGAGYPLHVFTILPDKETKTLTRTIVDELPSGTKTTVQTLNYIRNVAVDQATGHAAFGNWTLSSGSMPAYVVVAPLGYKAVVPAGASLAAVNGKTLTQVQIAGWQNKTIVITYAKLPAKPAAKPGANSGTSNPAGGGASQPEQKPAAGQGSTSNGSDTITGPVKAAKDDESEQSKAPNKTVKTSKSRKTAAPILAETKKTAKTGKASHSAYNSRKTVSNKHAARIVAKKAAMRQQALRQAKTAKQSKQALPQTGNKGSAILTVLGLALVSMLGIALRKKN